MSVEKWTRHILSRAMLLLGSLAIGASSLLAEGTAELMPGGNFGTCISYIQGNDGAGKEGPSYGRPWYDLVYVHIQDPSKEVIYYGFTRKLPTNKNVYYQILAPNGTIVASGQVANNSSGLGYIADNGVQAYVGPKQIAGPSSGGYQALTVVPLMAGDYAIQFNVNHAKIAQPLETKYYIHPFDVTVADVSNPMSPRAIPGRLFSYKWHINTNSATNKACMEFYTWTPDSLVMMMDMNEIQPWGFTVSFNSHGSMNTGNIAADRRSSTTVSAAVPEYRVFLNEPDPAAYPTGTPGQVEYIEINTCGPTGNLCIVVLTTKPGELNVYIDLDGTGAYEEGGADIYFPYQTDVAGEICIPWDGIDGYGVHIPDSMGGLVIVEFLAGVVHYPVYDPENHKLGFNCALIRPATGLQPLMYFDNRGTPIGTYNLDGCVSGCNTWSGNAGDRIMVNTWLNTTTSADTDAFVVSHLCPPIAYDDSSCTTPNQSIEIPILDNDSARTFPLDVENIILHPPLQGSGHIFYNPDVQLFTYIPDGNDSTTLIVEYDLCDYTPEELEGPLCDRGRITIRVYYGCPNGAILAAEPFPLHLWASDQGCRLTWPDQPGAGTYWVLRSLEGGPFEAIARVRTPAIAGQHRYQDSTPPAAGRVVYQVLFLAEGQEQARSTRAWTELPAHMQPWLEAFPHPEHRALVLRYMAPSPGLLQVVDALGRPMGQYRLPATPGVQTRELSTEGWPAGWYIVSYRCSAGQRTMRLRIE